jgi:hypothetical protein
MSQLLLIKKGDFKSGFLSKINAGEYHFFEDKIIFKTMGLSRIFNNAPITIEKDSIISFSDGFTLIGYSIKLNTKTGNYTLRFVGDKTRVYEILNSYIQ